MFTRITLIAAAFLVVAGCGKKSDTQSGGKSDANGSKGVSAESLLGSQAADSTPAPPDGTAPPAPTAPATEPPEKQAQAAGAPAPSGEVTPESATRQFKDAESAERAYEKRLARNAKWLGTLKSGTEQEKQRVLNEIKAANLPPAEIAELEATKRFFGVTVSFR